MLTVLRLEIRNGLCKGLVIPGPKTCYFYSYFYIRYYNCSPLSMSLRSMNWAEVKDCAISVMMSVACSGSSKLVIPCILKI